MHRKRWEQGSLIALAAVVLGVLIAQVAIAGGSGDGTIASLQRRVSANERQIAQLKAQLGGPARLAKTKVKAGPPGPAGPQGQAGNQGPQGIQGPAGTDRSCQGNGSGDAMVAAGAVCIDKYEASIWTAPRGGTQITGAIPCDDTGDDCTNIYARSVPGVTPSRDITWFQAQQALANVGKRLPTNAEWQQAVAGTPNGADNGTTDCNTASFIVVANTGSRSACHSNFGAFDMVGNLSEWVANWDEEAGGCANWDLGYGNDRTCLGSGASDTSTRFPAALVRGGGFSDGTNAGPYAIDGRVRPSATGGDIGFRGVN